MLDMQPIEDVNNYQAILNTCKNGKPFYLSHQGKKQLVVLDIANYNGLLETVYLSKIDGLKDEIIKRSNDDSSAFEEFNLGEKNT